MHLHPELIVLVLLTTNAAICAAVPASVKAKMPVLWAVLDALAANIGHATNKDASSKPWQVGVFAAVVGAVLSVVGLSAIKQPEPGVVAVLEQLQTDSADAQSLADAVSPADDVSAVSPTSH